MSRLTVRVSVLMSLMLLVMAAGCEDPNANMGQPDPAAGANDRIAELEDQLAQAERDRAAMDDRLLAMQKENNELKSKMAEMGEASQGWTSVPGGAMISVEGTVLFDSGKAVLKGSAQGVLDQIARAIMDQYADHDIYIFGHTDVEPIRKSPWKDNYELSCQRSLAVLRGLRSKGVGQDMAACGWGEDRPVADNATAAGKQANRRVEIFAMAKTK